MKKIATLILFFVLLGCTEKGTVYHNDLTLLINSKEYKLTQLVPCDGCHAIWIMYPKDSTVAQPVVVNYSQSNGKSSSNQTVIHIK
jgi:hypothetical protein